MGWTDGVQFQTEARDSSLLHSVQTGSEAHISPMVTVVSFKGLKQPGSEAEHSPPSNAEVTNRGAIPPLPCASSWRGV
jgi:hypothetical protein